MYRNREIVSVDFNEKEFAWDGQKSYFDKEVENIGWAKMLWNISVKCEKSWIINIVVNTDIRSWKKGVTVNTDE